MEREENHKKVRAGRGQKPKWEIPGESRMNTLKRPKTTWATLAVGIALLFPGLALAQEGSLAGRWDLTIESKGSFMPSWLEIEYRAGVPRARFVGRWGSARALPKIEIKGDDILFVSPKEEEGSTNDLEFR